MPFSHIPYHQLDIPDGTFTFTCIRNPVRRVLSHYKMLLAYQRGGPFRPDLEKEAQWLGDSFDHFLDNISKEHLLNQLYMFSNSFSVDAAFNNISKLSHFFFTEAFDKGVAALSAKMGLPLQPIHIRKENVDFQPGESDLARLRLMLEPEFELYERLQRVYEQLVISAQKADGCPRRLPEQGELPSL